MAGMSLKYRLYCMRTIGLNFRVNARDALKLILLPIVPRRQPIPCLYYLYCKSSQCRWLVLFFALTSSTTWQGIEHYFNDARKRIQTVRMTFLACESTTAGASGTTLMHFSRAWGQIPWWCPRTWDHKLHVAINIARILQPPLLIRYLFYTFLLFFSFTPMCQAFILPFHFHPEICRTNMCRWANMRVRRETWPNTCLQLNRLQIKCSILRCCGCTWRMTSEKGSQWLGLWFARMQMRLQVRRTWRGAQLHQYPCQCQIWRRKTRKQWDWHATNQSRIPRCSSWTPTPITTSEKIFGVLCIRRRQSTNICSLWHPHMAAWKMTV